MHNTTKPLSLALRGAIATVALFAFNTTLRADDLDAGTPTLIASFPISGEAGGPEASPNAKYSDITVFTGFAASGGGASGSPTLSTNAIYDDATLIGGGTATQMTFSVANLNTVAVSARPRIRIHLNDGAGGGPGTVVAGFTFNAISIPANNVQLLSFNPGISFPTGTLWLGEFYDNQGLTTTAAQLNNLGQGLFNPPDVGSSLDRDFLTSTPPATLANNPAGAIRTSPFLANPPANYAYEVVIPEPGTLSLAAAAGMTLLVRRRRPI